MLPFFWTGMKTDVFQSCDHYFIFQTCWYTECSTLTASSFRISSPPLSLLVVMLIKARLIPHSRMSDNRWVTTPSLSFTERLQWIKRKKEHMQPILTDDKSYGIWNLLTLPILRGFERNISEVISRAKCCSVKYLVHNYCDIGILQNSVWGLSIRTEYQPEYHHSSPPEWR